MIHIPLEDMKKAVETLSLNEKAELMHTLADAIKDADKVKPKEEKDWAKLVEKYAGCMGGLWKNEDPVEYQRSLREDRVVG